MSKINGLLYTFSRARTVTNGEKQSDMSWMRALSYLNSAISQKLFNIINRLQKKRTKERKNKKIKKKKEDTGQSTINHFRRVCL